MNCPVCGEPGGFHADGPPHDGPLPAELAHLSRAPASAARTAAPERGRPSDAEIARRRAEKAAQRA